MRQFALKAEGQSFNCDTDGRVLDSANVIGTWTTTSDNKIRIIRQVGGETEVPVQWRFNESNQLTLTQGGTVVFTAINTPQGLPRYRLVKNALVVDPDGDGDFEFTLSCRWGMDAAGTLKVSISGIASTIDGFIEDSRSRFRYQFFDKQLANFPSSLVFSGTWERITKGGDDKSIQLHFKLDDPSLEDSASPLNLPAVVKVDPARNHLVLIYQSRSNGERRLEFQGALEIKPNWTVSFRIADSKEGGVKKSRIEVETTFEWDHAQGKLALFVGREKRPGAQVIEVGGALQAQFKNGSLAWTFAYRNSTAGGQSLMTIATAVEFTFENNAIWIEYTQSGKSRKINITAKVVQENFVVSGGVEIAQDPQGRHLGAFIGVSF